VTETEVQEEFEQLVRRHAKRSHGLRIRGLRATEALGLLQNVMIHRLSSAHLADETRKTAKQILEEDAEAVSQILATGVTINAQ
jgi:hypothetical protein